MSSSATQKKKYEETIPSLSKNWKMMFDNDPPPPLSLDGQLQISFPDPEPGGGSEIISGSVTSTQLMTLCPIENGVVSHRVANIFDMSFNLTLDSGSYVFIGLVQETSIKGFFSLLPLGRKKGHVETEEGSWSAQAKPGPFEDEKKRPRKHLKRVSQ